MNDQPVSRTTATWWLWGILIVAFGLLLGYLFHFPW
jgi:hypothetical protein